MIRMPRMLTAVLAGCLAGSLTARGDDITRFSSKVLLRGKITEETATEVVIELTQRASKKQVRVPLNDIRTLNYDGAAGLVMRRARALENAGQYDKAIAAYREASAPTEPNRARALQFGQRSAEALQALSRRSGRAQALKGLEQFRASHPDTRFHYAAHELIGRLHLADGDTVNAAAAFAELAAAPWPETKMRGANWAGRILMQQGDTKQAAARFAEVIAAQVATEESKRQQQEAMVLRGECLANMQRFQEAEELLTKVIDVASPEEPLIQARAHNTLGDVHRAAGKDVDALLAYLYVELMYKTNHTELPRALYNLAQLWRDVERPGKASAALEKLNRLYPESEWAKQAAAE